CACFILFIILYMCILFDFFKMLNMIILDIRDSEPFDIDKNIMFVNTSLSAKHGVNVTTVPNVGPYINVSDKIDGFMIEQTRRQSYIHESCKQIKIQDHRSSLLNLYADRKHRLTFCPVYKSASTSWLISLLQLNDMWTSDEDLPRLQVILKNTLSKIIYLADPALSESSNRFIIVRHPFERLVSCYRDKFEVAKKPYYYGRYGESMVRSYRVIPIEQMKYKNTLLANVKTYVNSKDFKTELLPQSLKDNPYASPIGPTFAEFTKFVLESSHEDEHWKPMYKLCSVCMVDYNVIIKFENLYSESKSFIAHLNFTSVLKTRWDNPTKGGNTSSDRTCAYFKQLSINTVKRLTGKYNNDLLLFQYS
ncbi:unnamed protein product, partial [Meganyctiphanes norvegica]